MSNILLYSKISTLPPDMIQKIDQFVEKLKTEQKNSNNLKERKFGCAKGMFKIKDGFDF